MPNSPFFSTPSWQSGGTRQPPVTNPTATFNPGQFANTGQGSWWDQYMKKKNTALPGTFKNPTDGITQIITAGFPAALNAMNFWAKTQPLQQQTRMTAFGELDPSRNFIRAAQQGAMSREQADAQGIREHQQAIQSGYSGAVATGVRRMAGDAGINATNEAMRAAMDPDTIAKQRGMQLALLSDQELLGGADRIRAQLAELAGLKNQSKQLSMGQPTTAGLLTGLAGQYLSDPNAWNNILNQLGIGGGNNNSGGNNGGAGGGGGGGGVQPGVDVPTGGRFDIGGFR